jgi:hypothetical protein
MLSYGMLFVPLLAIGNYISQKNSIERQREVLTVDASEFDHSSVTPVEAVANPYAPPRTNASVGPSVGSQFRLLVGWISAGLSALFGIGAVGSLVTADFGPAFCGLLFSIVLGSIARTWIRKAA